MDFEVKGLISSVHTPFFPDYQLDVEGLKENLRFMIESGIDGVMITGTAGEFFNLTDDEKKAVWHAAQEVCKDKLLLITHTGDSSTIKTLEMTNYAYEIGIQYVMITVPYLSKPTQEEIYQHYKYIAENTKAKIVVYNNPSRSGVALDVPTTIALSKFDNIIAMKDSSRNLRYAMEVMAATKNNNFAFLSGESDLVIPILAMGGHGAIVTPTIILPDLFMKVYRLAESGDFKAANEAMCEYWVLHKCLGKGKKIHAAIKACVEMVGRKAGPPRMPLQEISVEEKEELRAIIAKYI